MAVDQVPLNTSQGKLNCPFLADALLNKTVYHMPLEFTVKELDVLGCNSIHLNSWIEQVSCAPSHMSRLATPLRTSPPDVHSTPQDVPAN